MRLARIPVLLAPFGLALSGCHGGEIIIDGESGVPLAKLVTAGQTAHEISLLGPDTVQVVHGAALGITVAGDPAAVAALRFELKDGKLAIARKSGTINGTATVTVTDPAFDHLVMAGSGKMTADRIDGAKVGLTIGGSGTITADGVAAGQLSVDVLGSGNISASGKADKLVLSIAGTGNAELAALKAGEAAIDVAGTGSAHVASDGNVSGAIIGTGNVTVTGHAHCDVSVTGTGKIVCQP